LEGTGRRIHNPKIQFGQVKFGNSEINRPEAPGEPKGRRKPPPDGSIILELPLRHFLGSRIFHVKLTSPLGTQLSWRRPDQCPLSKVERT
jgi:hypothetical protein